MSYFNPIKLATEQLKLLFSLSIHFLQWSKLHGSMPAHESPEDELYL